MVREMSETSENKHLPFVVLSNEHKGENVNLEQGDTIHIRKYEHFILLTFYSQEYDVIYPFGSDSDDKYLLHMLPSVSLEEKYGLMEFVKLLCKMALPGSSVEFIAESPSDSAVIGEPYVDYMYKIRVEE